MSQENQHNLSLFLKSQNLSVVESAELLIEHQEWRDRYKVSLSGHCYLIAKAYLPKFWLALNEGDYNSVIDVLNAHDGQISYIPLIDADQLAGVKLPEGEAILETLGLHYDKIDSRVSGLITATKSVITEIAHLVNREMDNTARNVNIIKDFDGILTFTSELGADFKLGLCFDKVKPIDIGNEKVVIQRTPITDEDLTMYLGESGPKVLSRLAHINKLVAEFFATTDATWNKEVRSYAELAINITILKAFFDQSITYITFGGADNWQLDAEGTPNSEACYAILDEELEHVIQFLDNIEKPEGVDSFAIDIDTYAIFGRDKDQRVVTPALQGYTEKLLNRYSQGFERLFSIRMGLNDNPHFFKA